MNVAAPKSQAVPLRDQKRSFDLLFSEGNLLQLLVAIRGSSMPDEEKMLLRDLVLEYSQLEAEGEKDIVRKQVMEGIAQYQSDFAFLATAVVPTSETAQSADPAVPETAAAAPTPATPPAPTTKTIGRGRPRPAFAASTPATPPAPDSASEAVPREAVTQDPTPEAPPTEPTKTPSPTGGASLKRIQAIKQAVNSRIGNPVNLIDADNAVGREYMNALLEAMKKVSGGEQSGALAVAMDRLETAYKNVETLLDKKGSVVSAPTPVAAAENTTSKEAPSAKKTEPVSKPAAAPAREPQVVTPADQPEATSNEPINTPLVKSIDVPTVASKVVPPPAAAPLQSVSARLQADHKTTTTSSATTPEAPVSAPGTPLPPKTGLKPVASVETLPEKMSTLKKVLDKKAEDKKAALTDDLENEQVTAGLQQLLSEWSLFKRSGILGTGPNGMDHPLYQLLRDMPMAAVISGRFEGATPQIKQSITDYMNGWRYEQNVVHEINELFEHYLRRVILSILRKQQENHTVK